MTRRGCSASPATPARLGFTVEPHTRTLVDDAVRSGALSTVTGARIGAELRLLAAEPDPLAALAALHELGLDTPLGLDGDAPTIERARRALALLPAGERPDRLVLAAALDRRARTDAPGALRAALDLWGFEAADREAIVAAASRSQELADALEAAGTPSEIAAAARHAPPELVALAGALGPAAVARQWLERLRHVAAGDHGRRPARRGHPARRGDRPGAARGAAREARCARRRP